MIVPKTIQYNNKTFNFLGFRSTCKGNYVIRCLIDDVVYGDDSGDTLIFKRKYFDERRIEISR